MKRTRLQRIVCLILSLTLLLGMVSVTAAAGDLKGSESTSSTLEEMKALVGTSAYSDYLSDYADYVGGTLPGSIPINVVDDLVISKNDAIGNYNSFAYVTSESEACNDSRLRTPEYWTNFSVNGANYTNTVYLPSVNPDKSVGSASWRFHVDEEQEGLYFLSIRYYNPQVDYTDMNDNDGDQSERTSVSAIQRKIKIDGKVPFSEVSSINLDKNWVYTYKSVSEPVEVPAGTATGTFYDYPHGEDGYFKVVTEIYPDASGKLMKTVTTYTISQDINGNSMTPVIAQYSDWNAYIVHDDSGYYDGYFCFFLAEGDHTITLEAERESLILEAIEWIPATSNEASIKSYADVVAEYQANGYTKAEGSIVKIEAEFPDAVSDASVVASNDNTSAINYPISSKAQLFNVIGETSYDSVGQWAAYNFTVSESGLYNLSMRYRQDALQGMFICRTIKISGGQYGETPVVPFMEAYDTRFDYNKEWQSKKLGDGKFFDANGNPVEKREDGKFVDANGNVVEDANERYFEFYFEKDVTYTIYLECSLGDLREYIQRVENTLERVNECYLKVIQRTGAAPDEYQDYEFVKSMPEVLVTFLEEAKELTAVADGLERLCGTNGSHLATLDTIARVLDTMGSKEGSEIAANMSTLKTYLGTLGTWINDSKRGSMTVDNICVVPANTEESLPKAKANFFQSIWFEISSFIYSFFTEYDQMGLTEIPDENTKTIDVWLASGRDQSNIWRSMIDAKGGFTDTYGTAVTLKLVTGGTLLPSILSGKGPDVYLGLGSADVINYAIRDAIIGISGDAGEDAYTDKVFSSYVYEDANGNKSFYTEEELKNLDTTGLKLVSESFDGFVGNNFAPAAMKTLTLCDVTYGVPLTMGFAMMFYRMDVLAELGEEVPESWDELLSILPVLQTNNMSIGVSYVNALDFMMYQMGGSMWKYTDETMYNSEDAGAKIGLDTDIALEAFEFVCRLYTDYSFPVSYDSANRFRTGEMPIVIGDYASIYNTLVVYATDIAGLWEFCSLPGSYVKNSDENAEQEFCYDSLASISATIILNGCKADELLEVWQFVQWQTSEKVQSDYGNRIVALIGPAAKYETANINAIENLSWTANEKAAILNQMKHLDAIVNYPGSYIIARYMKFAFLDVYNDGAVAHDAMMSYIDAINSEITRKRKEFDLPTYGAGEEPEIKHQSTTTE